MQWARQTPTVSMAQDRRHLWRGYSLCVCHGQVEVVVKREWIRRKQAYIGFDGL